MMNRIAAGLVAVGAVASLGAWGLQARAAATLEEAQRLQAKETSSDSSPPSAADNRAIIAALGDAIAVRRDIESILVRIEDDVAFLRQQQERAQDVTGQADEQLSLIGASLAGSVEASSQSSARLARLSGSLQVSARLARLIAQELAKLDRNMGPSAGGRP